MALIIMSSSSARQREHIEKARVRFLASSWMIRGTSGLNHDTYLAETALSSDRPPILIQLIDDYSNSAPPIPRETLMSDSGVVLRFRRDVGCDLLFGQMALRAAPSDLMAILPYHLSYDPHLGTIPKSDEKLPCYRLVRK
jgi:hypothetical protein